MIVSEAFAVATWAFSKRTQPDLNVQDIDAAVNTYLHLSERWFTHASPTLFNAGTPRPQLSSCFLIAMKVGLCGTSSLAVCS